MAKIVFTVRGIPRPQERGRSGANHRMTSKKAIAWAQQVHKVVAEAVRDLDSKALQELQETPLAAIMTFFLPSPLSGPNKGATGPHTAVPDGDNLEKLIWDQAMSAGLFKDDGQIWHVSRSKVWVPSHRGCGVAVVLSTGSDAPLVNFAPLMPDASPPEWVKELGQ